MRTRFQNLAVATAVVTVVLFAVGGLVRGTGSGLGCSTWPQCYPGQLFPSGTVHSLIEFSHRCLRVPGDLLDAGAGGPGLVRPPGRAADPLALDRLVPARARPGRARREGRRDRARPVVGDRALRGGARADRLRRVRRRRLAHAACRRGRPGGVARLRAADALVGRRHRRPVARRHLHPGEGARGGAGVPGLAPDGRSAGAHAGRGDHPDVPAPGARARGVPAGPVGDGAGPHDDRPVAGARAPGHARTGLLRGADRRRGRQRVLAVEALGGRAPRGVRGVDLGHGGGARDGRLGPGAIGGVRSPAIPSSRRARRPARRRRATRSRPTTA